MAKRQTMDRDFARYALDGVQAAIEKLQNQAAQLRRLIGERAGGSRGGRDSAGIAGLQRAGQERAGERQRGRRKRTMSAEARRRISEAQKARWAKQKGTDAATRPAQSSARKKR